MSTLRRFWLFFLPSVVQSAMGLLLLPFSTYILDPSDFGLFALLSAVTTVLSMLATLGAGYLLAANFSEQRSADWSSLVSTLLWTSLAVGCVLAGVLVWGWEFFAAVSPDLRAANKACVWLAAATMVMTLPWSLAVEVIRLDGRTYWYTSAMMAQTAVSAVALLLSLFYFQLGVVSLFVAAAFGAGAAFIGSIAALAGSLAVAPNARSLREILRIGPHVAVANLTETVHQAIERSILTFKSGLGNLGIYSHSQQYRSLASMPVSSVANSIWPVTLGYARQDASGFERTRLAWNATYIWLTAAGIGLATLGSHVIALLTHDKFTGAYVLACLWALYLLVQNTGKPQTAILYASGAGARYARIQTASMLLGTALVYPLVSTLGIYGAFIAALVQQVAMRISVHLAASRIKASPVQDYWAVVGALIVLAVLGLRVAFSTSLVWDLALLVTGLAVLALAARDEITELWRVLRPIAEQWRGRRMGLAAEDRQDVDALRAFYGPPATPGNGKRVVLLSYLPLPYVLKMEVLFARALQERGWSVSVLTDAKTERLARAYYFSLLGCEVLRLEDLAGSSRDAEIRERAEEAAALAMADPIAFRKWQYEGAPLALNVLATLSSGRQDGVVPRDDETRRRIAALLRRSMQLVDGAGDLYRRLSPALTLGVEKGFTGTCETFYAALRGGIDYVQWTGCHEPDAVMLKRYRSSNVREHPFSISAATWSTLRKAPWQDRYRDAVMAEFERGYKTGAWFRYKNLVTGKVQADKEALQRRLGLDPRKKTAVIYSHILSDANLFYGEDLFEAGFEEWLVETVRAAATNHNVNWVLKLHPANVTRNARVGYSGEYGELLALRRRLGAVPDNLRIVQPEDETSPLSFFGLTDWGITVRGTVGLELPCFGVPVLTAGSGRYSERGFTVDSTSVPDYLAKIRGIADIPRLTDEQIRLGTLYAYHLFRSRPARYGEVMKDVYEKPVQHPRARDLRFRIVSGREALAHPQVQRVARFLESVDEDFLDLEAAHG